MTMENRLRLIAAPILAVVAVAVALMVAAPSANASLTRQVYAQLFFGAPSVTVPQCNAAGTALLAQGRFDFFHCVVFTAGGPDQSEELQGFLITG
jgi:hypothetical protein